MIIPLDKSVEAFNISFIVFLRQLFFVWSKNDHTNQAISAKKKKRRPPSLALLFCFILFHIFAGKICQNPVSLPWPLHTHTRIPVPGYLWGPCFTTPLVGNTSSVAVIPNIFGTFSCLLPLFLKHLFKVWKCLFFLVGTSLWERDLWGHTNTHNFSYLWGPFTK